MQKDEFKFIGAVLVVCFWLLLPATAFCQLWLEFAHPNQPHPGTNGPIKTPELFADANAVVQRPMLVVLMEFTDVQHDSAHDVAYFEELFFGQNRANGQPSVAENFRASANGRLLLVPATAGDNDGTKDGIVGWVMTPHTYDEFCCDYIEITRKRAEAVRVADPFFDYSLYDANGDKVITKDELVVYLVNASTAGGANVRATDPARIPVENNTLEVTQDMASVTEHEDAGTFAHELGHQLLGLADLYQINPPDCANGFQQLEDGYTCNGTWYPAHPGPYSLMARYPPERISHIEAWAKIHLGFVKPLVVTHDGTYTLYDAETERSFAEQETQPEALIIYDPRRPNPNREYFLLENRNQPQLDDQGLAVWLINEDKRFWPDGLDLRQVVRLIRREGHWPTYWWADSMALWNGVDDIRGYDLTATSTPRNTGWTDGSSSYIEVYDISPAGPAMTFKVRMPPIFIDQANTGSEEGTQDKPFNTVTEGINAIPESPRTLRIAGGSYPGRLVISTPLSLKGWRNGNAILGN